MRPWTSFPSSCLPDVWLLLWFPSLRSWRKCCILYPELCFKHLETLTLKLGRQTNTHKDTLMTTQRTTKTRTHTHIMTHDVDLRMACMLMFIRIPYRHMRIGDPFRLYKPCSLPAQAHTRTLAHINNRKHMRAHTHTYKMEVPCTPIGSCENISTGNRKYINLALQMPGKKQLELR